MRSPYPKGTMLNVYEITYHKRGVEGAKLQKKTIKAKYAYDAREFGTTYNFVVDRVRLVKKNR